jgi:hypothetical protein
VERDLEPEEERERDLELREEEEEELLLPDEERENLPRRFFFLPRGDFCRASSFSYTCGNQSITYATNQELQLALQSYRYGTYLSRWMRSSRVCTRSCRECMRSSRVWMRSSRV